MATITLNTPKVYVGTYGKYNNGSIAGAWLDLTDYSCKEEFEEACRELHSDEPDPEFMFQDFENFPREFYSESEVPASLWDYINAPMSELEREAFKIWLDNDHRDISDFRDMYETFKSEYAGYFEDGLKGYAYKYAEERGYFKTHIPEHYIDLDAIVVDLDANGMWQHKGHVFFN